MKKFIDAGSYRDPHGSVYVQGDRILRTVMPFAAEDYEYTRSNKLFPELIEQRLVIPEKEVSDVFAIRLDSDAHCVLEHPKLPFISYPYEWTFGALKRAALLHLDIHTRVLEENINLSDASAYNVQFNGCHPIFIDNLSFRKYRDGEFWTGHRQFCEQFLNPLLLRSKIGIPYNAWYRGALEGISSSDLSRILPFKKKLSWNVFSHVVMQSSLQETTTKTGRSSLKLDMKFPKEAFLRILNKLRRWIEKLNINKAEQTVWRDYSVDNSYSTEEALKKRKFIQQFVKQTTPNMILDIGCNTGDYSKAALEAGAELAIGFDIDQGALEIAYSRAQRENLNFLPLLLDAANPSPNQGWREAERKGVNQRMVADGVLALAVVHHLAITRNIPLDQVVDWLVEMAPNGIIEFVQKEDPMVKELLKFREDIFFDYNEKSFLKSLSERATIVQSAVISSTGRKLFWYKRYG